MELHHAGPPRLWRPRRRTACSPRTLRGSVRHLLPTKGSRVPCLLPTPLSPAHERYAEPWSAATLDFWNARRSGQPLRHHAEPWNRRHLARHLEDPCSIACMVIGPSMDGDSACSSMLKNVSSLSCLSGTSAGMTQSRTRGATGRGLRVKGYAFSVFCLFALDQRLCVS